MGLIFQSLLLDLAALAAFVLAAMYFRFRRAYTYWKERNVPYIEPTFPAGNFADDVLFRKPPGEILKDIYEKLDGERFGGIYMFSKPGLVFRDPEIIKNVLVKDFSNFHDRGFYANEEKEPLSGHLFHLQGLKWRNLRVKLMPTFSSFKIKMMFQTLVDCGIELRECLRQNARKEEVVEIKDFLARYSTDVISSCAFGIQCNCLKNPDAEFRKWGRKLFEPTLKASLRDLVSAVAPSLINAFNIKMMDEEISNYFMNMVKETVSYREQNNIKRNDFMQLLIQIKNKGMIDCDQEDVQENGFNKLEKVTTDLGMSMESLAAQAYVFFIAGFETSSSTMTYCLYELSLNPDIQDMVRDEIDSVLSRHDGKITYDSIMEMGYLDKVVAESLRKYPGLPILNRECTKEYNIPGTDVVLNEGMPTMIPVMGLHYDPKYYPDPERFDPERFSEEEKAKRHQYVYLPFGEGPRICIGMRFGLMQTKVGLVSILSKYEICVSEKTPIPMVFDTKAFTLQPAGGMWLKIKERVSAREP